MPVDAGYPHLVIPDDGMIELPAGPMAAGVAREFVRRRWAGESQATLDDVTLCVSELVTNAVDHAMPPYELRMSRLAGTLRVEVVDASRREPTVKPVAPSSARGRGMFIVSNVAAMWGVDRTQEGKAVWAEFPVT